MTCPHCGQSVTEGASACVGCGMSISGGSDPPSDEPPTVQVVPSDRAVHSPSARSSPSVGPAASPAPPHLDPGARLGTRYEILSVLGEGGMGKVYKAHDQELDRTVALKVIRPDLAARPDLLARFKREILLASKVSHRNVLRIHDFGEVDRLKFISMNYVEGEDLKAVLRREGTLPLDRSLALIRQIGEGLQAAHDAGVVHRDLKPQNILIDREGNAYIGDFGISRSLESGATMTETGTILGTVDYMSPEQASGERPDHRADVYSFGVILYEIFTGALPFRGSDPLSVMMKRVHQDAPTIRQSRPEIPAWISAIVSRALRRDPAERYQSARDLLRDLERHRASIAWRRFLLRAVLPTLVVATLLAAGGYYVVRQVRTTRTGGPRASSPARAVAFLPFENATRDAALDLTVRTFPTLISGGLQDFPEIRILGGDRTQRTLEDLKLPLSGSYSSSDLRRAASVLGAEIVVTGVVRSAGGRFQAEARVQRAGRQGMQEIALERVEGQGEESVFSLADALAERIGRSLAVRSPQGVSRPATTRSVAAFRLYSEGLDLNRNGRYLDASKRLEEAVGKDPGFALAHALLSQTYLGLGLQDRALAASDAAVQHLEALPDHEARLIRARHAGLEGRLDRATEEYRALLEAYPLDADARFELATVLEKKSDLAAAATELEKCVSDDAEHVQAMALLGQIRLDLGDTAAALKIFSDLLGKHTQSGNNEGKGAALHALGNVHFQMGRLAEALGYYEQSYEIRRKIGDRVGMALGLEGIATVRVSQGQNAEAVRRNREALDLLRQTGDLRRTAKGWAALGESYEYSGQLAEAKKCYQEGLKIANDLDDPAILASISSSLAHLAEAMGSYAEAYNYHQEALAKRRVIGHKRELLKSLVDLTLIEQWQGRFEKALAYAAESSDIVREIGDRSAGAVLLIDVGTIHDEQGRYGRALQSLKEAAAGARAIGNDDLLASALLYLAGTLAHIGDFKEAEKYLDEAGRLADQAHDSLLKPEILGCRAEIQCARGEVGRCLKSLDEALRKARALGDRRLVILAELNFGRWSLATGRPGGHQHLAHVVEDAGASSLLPLRVRALGYLASAGPQGAPGPGAVAAAEQTLKEGKALELREALLMASHVLARHARARNEQAEARRLLQDAGALVREMAEGLEEPYRAVLTGRSDIARLLRETSADPSGNADVAGHERP